jgi:hypothetical protein
MLILCTVNAAEFTGAVDAFAAEIIAGTRTVVADTCAEAAALARSVGQFKDRTGALRRSIVGRVVRRDVVGTSGVIEATAPYANIVENGSRPHEIRPRRARFLRWETAGEVHFSKLVRHPGTRGTPFMGPAYMKAEGALYAKMDLLTARAVARFRGR